MKTMPGRNAVDTVQIKDEMHFDYFACKNIQ
jgi:hypothetical protein